MVTNKLKQRNNVWTGYAWSDNYVWSKPRTDGNIAEIIICPSDPNYSLGKILKILENILIL